MVLSAPMLLQDVPAALDWLRRSGVRRLVIDSRRIAPGDAFIAWPGAAHDARRFVPDALAAGAVVCLVDAAGLEAFGFEDERVAALADLKRQLGELASAFEGHPSRAIDVVAFTGTNGKTSSAWWLAQASGLLDRPCGLIGTLGVGEPPVGPRPGHWDATGLTTPDPVTLHRTLAALHARGVKRCAIEASSIGIVEHRLQGLRIEAAVFTNFTQDHLDYHGTLENYWAAKRMLFDWPTLRAAVIDIDDPRGAALSRELVAHGWSDGPTAPRGLWTTGLVEEARIRAASVRQTPQGMACDITERGGPTLSIQTSFFGAYNVRNLLGVIAALRVQGHELPAIVQALAGLTAVPGRMERRGEDGGPLAVIDYAHTPDALEKALGALRPLAQARGGRLWCVFGCGGDRDRSKRPQMGAIAERLADRIVLTSDNPRREAPAAIIADIRAGMSPGHRTDASAGPEAGRVHEAIHRAAAVAWALTWADDRDVVLVAGKGHEDYQEIEGVRVPSRDIDLIDAALEARAQALEPLMMTTADAARMLAGSNLTGSGDVAIRRVHTDTRSIRPGDLYVALKGERFDGHDFIAQARAAGAVAVMGERGLQEASVPGLEVSDSLRALQDLATAWRGRLSLPVIGVTGSNGKTTVTQMTASILRAWLGPQAGGTRGNLNNHIGVPLTVLSLRAGGPLAHRAAVVELGMNHPGEIAQLASIAQPTVAVVNNAQREHQEFMHTVEAVAQENGSVLQTLPAEGTAVFPADDVYAPLWAALSQEGHDRRIWRFAFDIEGAAATGGAQGRPRAEVYGRATRLDAAWALHLHTPVGEVSTTLGVSGVHNLHNAMAAAAAALAAGAPLWAVARGLADFEPVQGRSMRIQARRDGRDLCLVDDSYNANPDSVRAAIDLLAGLPGPQALILGDMGEVGDQGPAFHAEAGAFAASRGISHFWAVGDLCAHAVQGFGAEARHFDSVASLVAALPELPAVASILVKGSRFMRMERVVQALHAGSKGAH